MPPNKQYNAQLSFPTTQADYDSVVRISDEQGTNKSVLLRNTVALIVALYDSAPTLTTRLLLAPDAETKSALLRQIAQELDPVK